MKTRTIFVFSIILTSLCALADKKVTIVNADAPDESFEIAMLENLEIYEYNSNWLDSVPYLIEHAKWREPWAYEALAECCRNGVGGLEKSMCNASIYYDMGKLDPDEIAKKIYKQNPHDEFGLLHHIMGQIYNKKFSSKKILKLIARQPEPKPAWENLLTDILKQKPDNRSEFIKNVLLSKDLSSDESIIAIFILAHCEDENNLSSMFESSDESAINMVKKISEKIPALDDRIGNKLFGNWLISEGGNDKLLTQALERWHRVDQTGLLSTVSIARILNLLETNEKDVRAIFSEDDVARFDKICPDYYRELFMSPVEPDETSVEIIEVITDPEE